MTMKLSKRFCVRLRLGTLLALLQAPGGFAQTQDAQLWENLNFEKALGSNFTFRFSHEGRFTNNDSRLTYYYGDFGIGYDIPRTHFGILADYVFIRKQTTELWWSTRHQAYIAGTWKQKFGDFILHDRQMVMTQVKDINRSAYGKIPEWYLRNKVTLKYNFNFYWSAYVAEEVYWHMGLHDGSSPVNRMRYFAGMFYRPNRVSEFELYYLIEHHEHIVDPSTNYVLGVGYTLSL